MLIDEKSGKPYFKHIYKHSFVQWFMDVCWSKIMLGIFFLGLGLCCIGPLIIFLNSHYDLKSGVSLLNIKKITFLSQGQLNSETKLFWLVFGLVLGSIVSFLPIQYFMQIKLDRSRKITDMLLPIVFIATYSCGIWFVLQPNIFRNELLGLSFFGYFIFFCSIHMWMIYKIIAETWKWISGEIDQGSKMRLDRMNFVSGIIGVIMGLLFSRLI